MDDSSELTRFLSLDDIPHSGLKQEIVADPEERAALAERFNLLAIDDLQARLEVRFLAGGPMVRVTGEGHAGVVQACVITGDAVPNAITLNIVSDFAPEEQTEHGLELSLSDSDPAEPFVNGGLDLGELVAQTLAVSLDPYPRVSDASLGKVMAGAAFADGFEVNASDRHNPFGVLAKLADAQKK